MTRTRLHWMLSAAVAFICLATMFACSEFKTTPSATPSRAPAQPPQIVRRVPERGQEHDVHAPVAITFDQPMDRASVEASFAISPTVLGSFAWQDNSLLFTPAPGGLAHATSYRVVIGASARSTAGLALPAPFSFTFGTAGYLEITAVQPADGTQDVATDATVTVMFNRPVVPLSAIGASSTLPRLLTEESFMPRGVSGEGKWLNTSVFTFKPAEGHSFAPGTSYRLRIAAGLTDTTGAELPQDYTWQFSTELPKTVTFECSDPQEFVGPSPTISVTFNMAMDRDTVEQRFRLAGKTDGQSIPGRFNWSGKAVGFSPSVALVPDQVYLVSIASGARASAGGDGSAEDTSWTLHAAPLPAVLRTLPQNGDKLAEPYTSLQVTFSSPINRDSLLPNLTIVPSATEVYTSWDELDMQLYISFGAKPSTSYTFVFGPNLEGRYGPRLGQAHRITFTTRPLAPAISSPSNRVGTCNAYTTTAALVQHVNVSELELALYHLNRADFVTLNGTQSYQRWDAFQPNQRDLIRRWSVQVPSGLNAYTQSLIPLAEDKESALQPGFYYLSVKAQGVREEWRQMLVVSRANLALKESQGQALLWLTDLRTGQGMPGTDVSIFPSGQPAVSARTDSQGLAMGLWAPDKDQAASSFDAWATVVAIAGPDSDPAVASTDWSGASAPWMFNLPFDPTLSQYRAYFYTDRSIYRPGQTVYFKGILRSDDDGRYALPSNALSMTVTILDYQGKEIYRSQVPVSELGTLHGEVKLGQEAGVGFYNISAGIGEWSTSTGFQVAEYRKPEFEVSVQTDKQEYTQGDHMTINISAEYYFGGPVAGAKVAWRLMTQDYYFRLADRQRYDFTDPDYDSRGSQTAHGELLTSGSGATDEHGRFSLQLPADTATRSNSQILTLEASITDASNQEVSARGSALVHKGLFYIGLAPREFIGATGRESQVDVLTVDPKGAVVPDVPMTVVFLEQHWYNVQQQSEDGHYFWDWKLQEIPVYTTTLTTDGAGIALAAFVPDKGGVYRVRAFGSDSRENLVRSSTYVWISASDYVTWRQENNDRIELIADKDSYLPGETARVLVPSPFDGQVQALLTIERGRVLSHRILTLATNSDQIDIPILPEYAPNVYVSVFIVKGATPDHPVASYKLGYVDLNVSTHEKELTVEVTPDRQTPYQPGGKAMFSVRATDYQGHPVQAELSLQLVDQAVVALLDSSQGTLLSHFYEQRPLGVRTGSTLGVSVDSERERSPAPSGKGGSGGAQDSEAVRRNFLDTAYWNATVRTDALGQCTVTVELPDNLTTWRMTGKAVTAETLVGEGQTDIVSTKDLLVRPVAPRFFVTGDHAELGAVIHNNTTQPLSVSVSLQGQGIMVERSSQQVEVPANGQATVNWQVDAGSAPSAVLAWRAASANLSDAVELTLPIYTFSTPEVVATAGQVPAGATREEVVLLPERLDPTRGELTVQIDPSLAAGMRDGLQYLSAYPYQCTEQTVSRFLPNVITYQALKKLGISNPELEARLPQDVGAGLQRLYALKHYDGGWGWWLSDDSQPFLSAYVLLGLTQADRAGFAVDSYVMDQAAVYLQGALDSPEGRSPVQANAQAFMLYALAEYGHGDLGRTVSLYEKRQSLSNYGKACLALALHTLEPKQTIHTNTLLSDLANSAILSATGAHWEENEADYWSMNTNTRSTAMVLDALVRIDPQNGAIPNAVRWLMTARKEGHWETTQETAWSVMALTDFMLATGELQAQYDYSVTLNATTLEQQTVSAQTVGESRKLVVAVADLLRDEGNRLVLERRASPGQQTDKGQLYYSAYLRYFRPVEDVVALNRGIVVSRQYALVDRPDQPVTTARVGDVIQVKLTIIAPSDLHYLVVEDPLPAGCEALDTSLKTTSSLAQSPKMKEVQQAGQQDWYFIQSQLLDEKVALFATYLAKGTYEYTYLIRASVAGRFWIMPSNAFEMYFPEVFGHSDGGAFTIAP